MGTDIHSIFQRKNVHVWEDIPHSFGDERHYFLFSWLADVRNGYGFAGVPTGEPIEPISPQRGLPDDFQVTNDYHKTHIDNMSPRRKNYVDTAYLPMVNMFMGDHSHTWLLGSEIVAAYDKIKENYSIRYGIVTRDEYDRWDGVSCPEYYCGGISGNGVVLNDEYLDRKVELPPEITYVMISWKESMADNFDYYVNEVKRLMKYHGEIRHVMGFDS